MKKLFVAALVLMSLTACEDPGDALIRSYTGLGRVSSNVETANSCTLEIYMTRNGLTGHITREGRNSCPEEEGQILFINFGSVA